MDKVRNSYAKGNIILIGNSASWTNNHEYVFDYLRHLNLKEYKIVTPLNYGGNMDYRAKVNMLGHKYFGNSYGSLSKFLPLDEYNYLMTKAEVCIYGSWRQEAVGNIVIALYLGAKVFLSDKNPLFNELKNRGLTIFRLEDITQVLLDTPLSMDDKLRNREILLSSNSWERLKRITYEIFK